MKKIVGVAILAGFALVGCSTVGEKANDKLCTGTKRPYKVMGNWYTPQEDYNYKERGIASWYGPRFHGRPKSCGEIFNMHGVSAAHKTLPIPSVVQVTNVRNGSTVKLLVDDRGPFVDDRIIDLSKGAATYLGLCNQGLGEVHVECLPNESKAFASFVAQYGRYGRDPSGRTWEAIFREKFDRDGRVTVPKSLKAVRSHQAHKNQHWVRAESSRKSPSFRRPTARPIPVSDRGTDDVSQGEIDALLNDTRTYLGRKQV
jgi:rare lipoprotein A